MGIRYLNKYFIEHCKECIQLHHMSELKGKIIVIDISIYLYKYHMNDALIENMYLMLSLFQCYEIIPVFIFDGKPPIEKKEVLDKRYHDKIKAENECKDLYKKMENTSSLSEREAIIEYIQTLKKKCVFLRKDDIYKVQQLITAFGYTYYTANGEADELCALFVRYKKAWACMSEDMDMFVYGIPRVLRYLSLVNNTVVLYDRETILKKIGISSQNFMELCIMSGSDYTKENITDVYQLFSAHNKYVNSSSSKNLSFRVWLQKDESIHSVQVMDNDTFSNVRNMFISENSDNIKIIQDFVNIHNNKNSKLIQNILEEDGFVYPVSHEVR